MSTRIELLLQRFPNPGLAAKGISADVIRLLGRVELEMKNGWSEPHLALIDTGAPMCLLPLDRWERYRVRILAERYLLRGIVPEEECTLPVRIGKVVLRFVDEEQAGKRIETEAYLAPSNEVPLVLGFHRCLDQYRVVFDCEKNVAYAEEKG